MGEKEKRIGDLGEDLATSFLNKLGWQSMGAWNQDFACASDKHMTKGESAKKKHGIDGVYSYIDPYTEKYNVILIESKAISWREKITKGRGKREHTVTQDRNITSISSQLKDHLKTFNEKIECSLKSPDFITKYDLQDKDFTVIGTIIYYVQNNKFDELKFQEACEEINYGTEEFKTQIFVCHNGKMEIIKSIFNDLEKKILKEKQDDESVQFFNFNFERKKAKVLWTDYLTLDHIYSSFCLARFKGKNSDKCNIYYYGEYSNESFKRFLAALSRYQIFSNPEISVSFLNVNDNVDAENPVNRFFGETNQLFDFEIGKLNLKSDQPSNVKIQFSIVRGKDE